MTNAYITALCPPVENHITAAHCFNGVVIENSFNKTTGDTVRHFHHGQEQNTKDTISTQAIFSLLLGKLHQAAKKKQRGPLRRIQHQLMLFSHNDTVISGVGNQTKSGGDKDVARNQPPPTSLNFTDINLALDVLEYTPAFTGEAMEITTLESTIGTCNGLPKLHVSMVNDLSYSLKCSYPTPDQVKIIFEKIKTFSDLSFNKPLGLLTLPIKGISIDFPALKLCATLVMERVVVQYDAKKTIMLYIHRR